jgi:hypothetical protein
MTGCAPNWRAVALAASGLALTFAAPQHRLDLLLIGLAAALGGVVWSPLAGPLLIGAALPLFFFSRAIGGPLSVTPPGLALILTWLAVALRHRSLDLKRPLTSYDVPLALFLVAALLSLLVTEYPLLSVRELRAVIFEPVAFFMLLYVLRGASMWALAGFLASATLTALTAVAQGPLGLGGTQAEGVLRAQAWYPSANHLALMLGRALPFLLAAAIAGRRWAWLPVLLVALASVLTFSTGGWLGALSATVVVVGALGYRRLAAGVGGVGGGGGRGGWGGC